MKIVLSFCLVLLLSLLPGLSLAQGTINKDQAIEQLVNKTAQASN